MEKIGKVFSSLFWSTLTLTGIYLLSSRLNNGYFWSKEISNLYMALLVAYKLGNGEARVQISARDNFIENKYEKCKF